MATRDSTDNASVIAVVLTWNDTILTGRCIQSLLRSDYSPLRVVVVDNGSREPCGDQLKECFPAIETVVLAKNEGFTGGANRGLEAALRMDADYIFFLNNDTVVECSAIRQLVAALEERAEAGVASPLLLYPGSERRVQYYTGRILRDCGRQVQPEDGLLYGNRKWPTISTEFAPATALLFRARALLDVGLFDESLGTCWEDYDLSIRFNDAGWGYVTVGGAEVVHVDGATTGRASPYITYYLIRNRLICMARYARPWGILRCAPQILRSFWWQVKAYGLTNWACHRAFAAGVRDFVLGVRGEGRAPNERGERSEQQASLQ